MFILYCTGILRFNDGQSFNSPFFYYFFAIVSFEVRLSYHHHYNRYPPIALGIYTTSCERLAFLSHRAGFLDLKGSAGEGVPFYHIFRRAQIDF
jgi:hypothetical protein